MSCVYKITNITNNKIYIGSTVNLKKRKNNHLRFLRKNKHCNIYLQKSFNKYGEHNFQFQVLEKCSPSNLVEREQYYIDTLNPNYNICKIAGSILGIKRSQLTCRKLSISNTGKIQEYKHKYNNSVSHRKKKGKIYQFDKNYKLLKIWDDTITNIANELNMNRTTISESIRLNRISKEFIWKVESEVSFG